MNTQKRLFSLSLAVLILLTVLPLSVFAVDKWEGYTPISTKQDLNAMRNDLAGKYYLTADIVFTPADFTETGLFPGGFKPIGSAKGLAFAGVFDGNGHTIYEIKFFYSKDYMPSFTSGIFGYNAGTIENLTMDGSGYAVDFSFTIADSYAGGIAAYNMGSIKNCENRRDITSLTSNYIGGIAAFNTGLIENCRSSGRITTDSIAGGIAGYNFGTIQDCINTGDVTDTNAASKNEILIGGIVGHNRRIVKNSANAGAVSSVKEEKAWIGGVVGNNHYSTSDYIETIIDNCVNTGAVSAIYYNDKAGGIAGENWRSITNSANMGAVFADSYPGGITSLNYGVIEKCYNKGDVTAENWGAGGIVCKNFDTVKNTYNTGSIHSYAGSGGIVRYLFDKGEITNSYNIGNVFSYYFPGAIAEMVYGGTILNTYFRLGLPGIGDAEVDVTSAAKGLTASQLKAQTSFTGFDFNSIWTMDGDSPKLQDVSHNTPNTLQITQKPTKTKYALGESFVSAGLQVTLYDQNGDATVVVPETVTGFIGSVGTNVITVTYGGKTASFHVHVDPENPRLKADTILTIKGSYVFGLQAKAEGLRDHHITDQFEDTIGLGLSDIGFGTGASIIYKNKVFRLVVKGDINGDGKIDAKDYLMLKRMVLGTYTASDAQIQAGVLRSGEKPAASDYLMLKRHVLGTFNIYN